MYGKLFDEMYDGTLSDTWEALVTFQQLLILCTADGVIDMTPCAISRRTGIPIEIIRKGITVLEAPDPHSRTPDMEGVRIKLLDDHRDWGWFIVNHKAYRDRISRDEKRDADRVRMAEKRAKSNTSQHVADSRGQSRTVASGSEHPPIVADVAHSIQQIHTQTEEKQEPRAREGISPVVLASILMNKLGCRVTPSNPDLIAAIAEGVTPQALEDLAELHMGKSAGYVIQTARGQHADGAKPAPQSRGSPRSAPSKTASAVAILEGMKHGKTGRGMVPRCDPDGVAEARFLEFGQDAGP